MLRESVAQKPTMPVSEGKKKAQNAALEVNLLGCARIGPSPFPAEMAHHSSASAATGRKYALNTSNFRMLSTPRYTTYIFTSQNRKNTSAGPVSSAQLAGNMGGNFASPGTQSTAIW